MTVQVEVKTTNEYKSEFGKSFSGKIVKRNNKKDEIVLVQEDCGCSHWVDVSWLKPIDDSCQN